MIQEAGCTLAKFLIFFQAYFDEIDELITVLPVGILRDVEIDFASFVRRYVTDNKQVQNDSKRVNVSLIKYIWFFLCLRRWEPSYALTIIFFKNLRCHEDSVDAGAARLGEKVHLIIVAMRWVRDVKETHYCQVRDSDFYLFIGRETCCHSDILRRQVFTIDLLLVQVGQLFENLYGDVANFLLWKHLPDRWKHVQVTIPLPNELICDEYMTLRREEIDQRLGLALIKHWKASHPLIRLFNQVFLDVDRLEQDPFAFWESFSRLISAFTEIAFEETALCMVQDALVLEPALKVLDYIVACAVPLSAFTFWRDLLDIFSISSLKDFVAFVGRFFIFRCAAHFIAHY